MNIIRCGWVEHKRSVWLKWKGTEFETVEISWLMHGLEIWHRSYKSYKDGVNKLQLPAGRRGAFAAADEAAYIFQCNVKERVTCEVLSCTPKCFSIGQAHFKALLKLNKILKKEKKPTTTTQDTSLGITYYIHPYCHYRKKVCVHMCESVTHACNLWMPSSY